MKIIIDGETVCNAKLVLPIEMKIKDDIALTTFKYVIDNDNNEK